MIHAGIREFRDRATHFLGGNEPVAIERHGRIVGYFIPVATRKEEEGQRALKQLQLAVEKAMAETGLDQDALADMFDLAKPFE